MQAVMGDDNVAHSILISKDDFLAIRELSQDLKWEFSWNSAASVHKDHQKDFSSITSKELIRRLLDKDVSLRLEDLKVILHNQDDLVPPGHVYVFTGPSELGEVHLTDIHLIAEKRSEDFEAMAYMDAGANIFNVYGVARIELTR